MSPSTSACEIRNPRRTRGLSSSLMQSSPLLPSGENSPTSCSCVLSWTHHPIVEQEWRAMRSYKMIATDQQSNFPISPPLDEMADAGPMTATEFAQSPFAPQIECSSQGHWDPCPPCPPCPALGLREDSRCSVLKGAVATSIYESVETVHRPTQTYLVQPFF